MVPAVMRWWRNVVYSLELEGVSWRENVRRLGQLQQSSDSGSGALLGRL